MVDLVTTLGTSAGYYASQEKAVNVEDVFSVNLQDFGGGGYQYAVENDVALADGVGYAVYLSGDGHTNNDGASLATTDPSNNIYVATIINGGNDTILIRKYSDRYQTLIWSKAYTPTTGGINGIRKVYYSPNNNLYIIGGDGTSSNVWRISPANGSVTWVRRFSGSNGHRIFSMVEDSAGDYVYVCGSSWDAGVGNGTEVAMAAKLSVTNGSQSWTQGYYQATDNTQQFWDVTLLDGNLFACGFTHNGTRQMATIAKIELNFGNFVDARVSTYTSVSNSRYYSITNDGTDIYVTGDEAGNGTPVLKYNTSLANSVRKYLGFSNEIHTGWSIHIINDKLYLGMSGDANFYFNNPDGFIITELSKTTLEATSTNAARRFISTGTAGSMFDMLSGAGKAILNLKGAPRGQYQHNCVQLDDIANYQNHSSDEYFPLYQASSQTQAGALGSEGTVNLTDNVPDGGWSTSTVTDITSTATYDTRITTEYVPEKTGRGGLVWAKARGIDNNPTYKNHHFFDTVNGFDKYLRTTTNSGHLTFSDPPIPASGGWIRSGDQYISEAGNHVSWTFGRAPGFFDIVTYTGDGTTNRTIPHNLGSVPGMIIWKTTNSTSGDWVVWHKDINLDSQSYTQSYLRLNATNTTLSYGDYGYSLQPTAEVLNIPAHSNVSNTWDTVNRSGNEYTAYVFGHNDGDGTFGESKNLDIIKCGNYTGTGTSGNYIELGFEPQFVMLKRFDAAGSWEMFDMMRGMTWDRSNYLRAEAATDEVEDASYAIRPASNGFQLDTTGGINGPGSRFIYIAIRRPTATPKSAGEVFAIDFEDSPGPSALVGPTYHSEFPVDMALYRDINSVENMEFAARLIQGKYLSPANDLAYSNDATHYFDYQNGWNATAGNNSNKYSWMWRRAPGFFDATVYKCATDAGPETVKHNLGVVPDMVWVKDLEVSTTWWYVTCPSDTDPTTFAGGQNGLRLHTNDGLTSSAIYHQTPATATEITLNGNPLALNRNIMICLFASLDGISKIGTYDGSSSIQTIDCGFNSGARFVLIKAIASSSSWYLFDSRRGIVANAADPTLILHENTVVNNISYNYIDPDPSGFKVGGGIAEVNQAGTKYLFYAIA